MNKLMILSLVISLTFSLFSADFLPPENYYQGCSDLNGEHLKNCLHQIISGHTVFPYFGDGNISSGEILMELEQDPQNPDNLICFYSGFSYPKSWADMGSRADYKALGTTQDNSWNREHVWSKSHGFPDMNADIAYSDVHNLRPEDRTVNTAKGEKDFDWGGFPEPEVQNCFTDADSWDPPDRVKGDIARCLFYMAVRYEGSDTPYDLEIVDYTNTEGEFYGKLSTLLEWHKLDPPDDLERRRNHIIFTKYQHNRNPFIDHPEYAFRIWGEPDFTSRLSTSYSTLYFDAVQGSPAFQENFIVTAVNQSKKLSLVIEEYPDIFSFYDNVNTAQFIPYKEFINQEVIIYFNPISPGSFSTTLLFSGFEHEVSLKARVLPKSGIWLINQDFNLSLADFNNTVLQGNKKYGWYHSSWDNDIFVQVRGNHNEFSPREAWLTSSPLDLENIQRLYLNFRTARNDLKSPDQFQVFFASELPDLGIPADVVKIEPLLSQGNYNWEDSSWLIFDKNQLPDKENIFLLFRYYYDGDPKGQETWELDDIKLYGEY